MLWCILPYSNDRKISLRLMISGGTIPFTVFFPSLDILSTQGYRDGGPRSHDDQWSSELALSLRSQIYSNGLNILDYRRAKLEKKRGALRWERDRAQLCLELSREYFNYSLALETFKVQEVQYKLLGKQFKSVESQYKRGQKKRIDYVRFKARLQRAKLGVQQANVVIKRGLEEIKRVIGWKGGELSVAAMKAVNLDLGKIPENPLNIEDHYEYKIVELSRKINDDAVTRERKKYFPELSLAADASYAQEDYLSGTGTSNDQGGMNWSAMLTIRFNLWDWGKRRRNVAIANLERMNRNNALDGHLLSLKGTIRKLLMDIKQRKESFLLNRELVELEKNNYATLEENYRRGMTTFLDLINALNDYTSSRQSWFGDFFQLKILMAEFYFHQGVIYETIKKRY